MPNRTEKKFIRKLDDQTDISKSNECLETTVKSTFIDISTTRFNNKNNSSLSDATMHLAPPLKDNLNTDFNIPQHATATEMGRNSVSRQSLIGKFRYMVEV